MSLSIGTNNAAMRAAEAASISTRSMETSMERLSTGKRINASSDDAAGVAIASRLSVEILGANQAIRNSLDGQALIDTAEGAHKEIENILQRMREIAVQAANDTNNDQDRANLQAEMDAMIKEIDRIAETTTWAGTNLMSAAESDFSFQVGTATGTPNQIKVKIGGMGSEDLKLTTDGVAYNAIGTADARLVSTNTHVDDDDNPEGDDDDADAAALTIAFDDSAKTATIAFPDLDPADFSDAASAQIIIDGKAVTLSGDDANADILALNAAFKDSFGVTASLSGGMDIADDFSSTGGKKGDAYITLTFADVPVPANISVKEGGGATANSNATTAISTIDNAIKEVNDQRSELGAISNRLNHTVNNLTNISSNLSAAKGGIEDADFALETTNLAKNQILQQASTAMLAQANASKQNVLSLLQG
jgi:flagellin